MKTAHWKIVGGLVVIVALCAAAELATHAQVPQPPRPNAQPARPVAAAPAAAPVAQSAQSTAAMDAERAQIWNSPNMLRARAWVDDYCSRSAKITPEEKQQYMTELQNLTPTQMKLWLLKFDQEEEHRQQQYGMWEQAHSNALNRAMAADKATQKSYAAINKEETQAAGEAQQQVNEEQAFEQNQESNKSLEVQGAYGPNGYQGYGGVHYHFHLYPY